MPELSFAFIHLFSRYIRNITPYAYFVNGFIGDFSKSPALPQTEAPGSHPASKESTLRHLKNNGMGADKIRPLAVVLPLEMGVAVRIFQIQIALRVGKLLIDIKIEDMLPVCQRGKICIAGLDGIQRNILIVADRLPIT